MNDRDDTGPYIPERYRQQIAARKRRGMFTKIGAILIVIVLCGTAAFFLSGAHNGTQAASLPPISTTAIPLAETSAKITFTPEPENASPIGTAPEPSATIAPNQSTTLLSPALITAQKDPGILPYGEALRFLREEFPAATYTVVSADISSVPPSGRMYSFLIRPLNDTLPGSTSTQYLDAVTGDPYTPGQEKAAVPLASAKNTIADTFASIHPDGTRIRYSTVDGAQFWNFTLIRNNSTLLAGSIDAETGNIAEFASVVPTEGRPGAPVIDNATAMKIAEQFISDRTGPVSINISDQQYIPLNSSGSPVAGSWVLRYSRLFQGYPCDADGFTVTVDSVSGNITGYERIWNAPDYGFAVAPDAIVLKRDATYTVLHKAQNMYPGLATGINILSADVRWKDAHPAGTVPRPASIPLAWKVSFDDAIIRAMPHPVPAVAWVDAQNGNLIEIDYQH